MQFSLNSSALCAEQHAMHLLTLVGIGAHSCFHAVVLQWLPGGAGGGRGGAGGAGGAGGPGGGGGGNGTCWHGAARTADPRAGGFTV